MRLQVGSLIAALLCFAGLTGTAGAQTPGNAPASCAAAEHRQFAFWIGEWNVTNPAGAVADKNRITRILNGRVLLPVRNRITWTPRSATEVRQLWETSSDGGAAWTTAFDGTYRKVQ